MLKLIDQRYLINYLFIKEYIRVPNVILLENINSQSNVYLKLKLFLCILKLKLFLYINYINSFSKIPFFQAF